VNVGHDVGSPAGLQRAYRHVGVALDAVAVLGVLTSA